MWRSIHKQIEKRITELPRGSVFAVSDFSDLADPKTVSKTMSRLSDAGVIKKIMRGVFWLPLDNGAPHPNNVAHALARENIWRLVPSGSTALHLLGLSKESPTVWTYVTDGTYRTYFFDGNEISFQHTTGKSFHAMSERAALLVQALKAFGPGKLTAEMLKKIRACFRQEEAQTLISETKNSPNWIVKTVRTMFLRKDKPEKAEAGQEDTEG